MKEKSYRSLLSSGKASITVWGAGYIGLTSAMYFAKKRIKVTCYDINRNLVRKLQSGKSQIPNLEKWLGFTLKPLVKSGFLLPTISIKKALAPDALVHIIAVPTENKGKPFLKALEKVIDLILAGNANKKEIPLIMIESTIVPGTTEKLIFNLLKKRGCVLGRDFYLALAPRRDWFHSPDMNMRTLPRVVCGTCLASQKALKSVLGIVCNNLIISADFKIAELVKSVENSLLHVASVYSMQLARAFPDIDIIEVLRLAATHWRIPLYYPSVGTGGYCIPLSSKYIMDGTNSPGTLTILKDVLDFDKDQTTYVSKIIYEYLEKHKNKGSIGFLGITYKGDLKVHVLSPALSIINNLKKMKVKKIFAHDPYYRNDEISALLAVKPLKFPEDLAKMRVLILVPDHSFYKNLKIKMLLTYIKPGTLLLDNLGALEKYKTTFKKNNILYFRIGNKGWTYPGKGENEQ